MENLTTLQYISFKFSFPFIDTTNLIVVPSTIKTPTTFMLMNKDDFEIRQKQTDERKYYVEKIMALSKKVYECKNSEEKQIVEHMIDQLHISMREITAKHKRLHYYFLLKNDIRWHYE